MDSCEVIKPLKMSPLIPAQAGIQIHPQNSGGWLLDPRLRGDERNEN